MAATTGAGAKVFIATSAAAYTTPQANAAAYAALTWTEVSNLINLPLVGINARMVSTEVASIGRQFHMKGGDNNEPIQVQFIRDHLNAGHIAMAAAAGLAEKRAVNIRIELDDAADANDTKSNFYFGAVVSGGQVENGTNTDPRRVTYMLGRTTDMTVALGEAVA